MAAAPLITFKAGRCEQVGRKVKPVATPGYVYLYLGEEDELLHFCWRPRNKPSTDPEVDVPDFGTSIYDTRWRIALPEQVDGIWKKRWYRSFRTLTAVRAGEMSGRGTVVWVVKEEGRENPFPQIEH